MSRQNFQPPSLLLAGIHGDLRSKSKPNPTVGHPTKPGTGVGIQIVSCDLAHIVSDTARVRFSLTFVGEPGSTASLRHLSHCLGGTSGIDAEACLARIISFRQEPPSGPV